MPNELTTASCLECDWTGPLAACRIVDDVELCPRCAGPVDSPCEPLLIPVRAPEDRNAITR